MPRRPRLVVPGLPHHVIQRGNRNQPTFFDDEDYQVYKDCLHHACKQYGVSIWCYCLMTNHTHLIVVPNSEESLSKAIGRGHEAYSRYMNYKNSWRGLLWQNRYRSYPMDEGHLYHCCKYVELNPVRAQMVQKAEEYTWSSARAHLGLAKDPFIDINALKSFVDSWANYLEEGLTPESENLIRGHRTDARPLGGSEFTRRLEQQTGRNLQLKKAGRPAKA